jgi:hypothetical protein
MRRWAPTLLDIAVSHSAGRRLWRCFVQEEGHPRLLTICLPRPSNVALADIVLNLHENARMTSFMPIGILI